MQPTIRTTWRAAVFAVSGLATGVITLVVALLVTVLTLILCRTVVAAPLGLAVLAATTRVLTSWQSGRFASLLGVELAPPSCSPGPPASSATCSRIGSPTSPRTRGPSSSGDLT